MPGCLSPAQMRKREGSGMSAMERPDSKIPTRNPQPAPGVPGRGRAPAGPGRAVARRRRDPASGVAGSANGAVPGSRAATVTDQGIIVVAGPVRGRPLGRGVVRARRLPRARPVGIAARPGRQAGEGHRAAGRRRAEHARSGSELIPVRNAGWLPAGADSRHPVEPPGLVKYRKLRRWLC
jgi:hypothetical protein